MRHRFLLTPGLLVLAAMSLSQVASEPAAGAGIAPGTVLSAELATGLDARKCRANDKIQAKTATDFLVRGQIVVPRNTEITGHITEAKAHSKSSPGSMVGIAFDRILLKDGREVPLQMTLQAIARPLPPATNGEDAYDLGDASAMPQMPRGGVLTPSRPATAHGVPPASPSHMPELPSAKNPRRGNSNPNALDSTSRGVFGIKGLALDTPGPVSVLSSSTGNVHLDGGTQLTLRVQ